MKLYYYLFLFIPLLLFASCEGDEVDYGLGEYQIELTTCLNSNTLLLDNGKLLTTDNPLSSQYNDGDRIYLMFSYVNDDIESVNRKISVHSSSKIPLGKVQLMSKEEIDEQINHPIRLESVWTGSRYLNMLFYIEFNSVAHSIGLICDKEALEQGNIELYFLHSRNDDAPGAPVKSVLSFDLSSELGEPIGEKDITVHINSSNYGDKTYTFVY